MAVKTIPPSDFSDDRKIIQLVGAQVNAVDELGSARAISSEDFKNLITGEPIVGRDVFKSAVQFRSRAQHVFATNHLPSFGGGFDRGVQRRLLVLTFNRSIPTSEKIANLAQRILSEEGDALLALAVEGAARLIKQKRFTEPPSSREALREWIYGADPVLAWLDARTELDEGCRTSKKTAYNDFVGWADQEWFNRSHLPSINNFTQRVRAQYPQVGSVRNNRDGRQFVGLQLKPDVARGPGSLLRLNQN
jgi:P4 family phage/plasmid primase-like protien